MGSKKKTFHGPAATPTIKLETITPAIAKDWLCKNHFGQRNLNQRQVANLASIMQAGQWTISNDAVAFDVQGFLINGQHRLAAVVKSDTSQMFMVARDMPAKSFECLDTNRVRSLADAMTMDGLDGNRTTSAIARVLYHYDNGLDLLRGANEGNGHSVSRSTYLDFAREHSKEIGKAAVESRKLQNLKRIVPPSILGLIYIVLGRINESDRDGFLGQVDSMELVEKEDPEYQLRSVLNNWRLRGEKTPLEKYLAFTFKAWNLRRTGNRVQLLAWKSQEEFPTPR